MTNERGQVTTLVLGLALLTFAIAGLAVDGTRAFLLRRTLQNAADASALAAAAALDERAYYESGGTVVLPDPSLARRVALESLDRRGLSARPSISVLRDRVHVVLRGDLSTTFLSVVGIARVPVAVEAVAEPIPGTAAR